MKKQKSKFLDRLDLTLTGLWHVLSKPRYMIFAWLMAFVLSVVLYLSINSGYYGALLMTPMLSFTDKIGVLGTLVNQMGREYFTTLQGFVLLLVALLQGVAFSLMLYNVRRNKRLDTGSLGKSGFAMVATTLGLGCVPCGTSLVLPLLSLVFSSTTSLMAAANVASLVVMLLALGLSVYTVYKLGYIAIAHKALEETPAVKVAEV